MFDGSTWSAQLVHFVGAAPGWTDKVTAIGTAIAAIGFAAAAVGAWLAFDQLKESRLDRHVQIISEFGRRWDGDHVGVARELQRKYDNVALAEEVATYILAPARAPDVTVLLRVPNYFEDLALLVELGRLDLKYVERAFGQLAKREWAYWELAVLVMRTDAPGSYTEFGDLMRSLSAAS